MRPSTATAHVKLLPVATDDTPVSPATATGLGSLVLVMPVPIWPEPFEPQQNSVPSIAIAQVCEALAEIAAAGGIATGTGVPCCVVDPSPSWPEALSPQQLTAPPASIAHAWTLPAASAVTRVRPATCTGVRLSLIDPSPSCPLAS